MNLSLNRNLRIVYTSVKYLIFNKLLGLENKIYKFTSQIKTRTRVCVINLNMINL